MSKVIVLHSSQSALRRFAEDVHGVCDYTDMVIDSIQKLWRKFGLNMENPYNVSLCNVMHFLSKKGVREEDMGDLYEDIITEVEASFYHCDRIDDLDDSDVIGELFYLFCPLLMDYLIEEEQVYEIGEYNIEFITIHRDRIDITI